MEGKDGGQGNVHNIYKDFVGESIPASFGGARGVHLKLGKKPRTVEQPL